MSPSIRPIGNKKKHDRLLNETFQSEVRSGFVEVGKDNFCLPIYYEKFEKAITQFEVRDSDVFVVAHPKTGTTWAQEMIWLMVNNLDYERAQEDILMRFPTLETAAHIDGEMVDMSALYGTEFMTYLNDLPEPRCIKSHLHWSLLPEQIRNGTKTPKIISVLRNPEDTCVSFYHHCKLIEGYRGTFDQFCDLFIAGRTMYGPFWKSVLSVWKERHRSNVLFIKYIDMKKDLPAVIKNVAAFLGRDLNEEAIDELAKHLSFDSMKKNPAVNFEVVVNMYATVYNMTTAPNVFIRRGIVGGYKTDMTIEQIQKFKKWTEESLHESDIDVE